MTRGGDLARNGGTGDLPVRSVIDQRHAGGSQLRGDGRRHRAATSGNIGFNTLAGSHRTVGIVPRAP